MPDSGTLRRPAAEDVHVLEERVFGLGKEFQTFRAETTSQIAGIAAQISAIGAKIEDRAKVPWQAMGVVLSALVVVGGLVWYPQNDRLTRLTEVVEKLIDTNITRREYEGRLGTLGQLRDQQAAASADRIERLEKQVRETASGIVPRGEHTEKWLAQRDRDADLQRQVDSLRKDFGELYSPRDALKSMQQRIDDLDRQLRQTGSKG